MNKEKFISVVTCVYNGGKTIEDTILSVVNQDYENYELLIIDGVSKDNTVEIAERYATSNPRVKVHSEKDKGIYDAYNKGAKKAEGDVVIFVNADDFLFPGALKGISEKFYSNEYDIFAGSISILNEEDQFYKEHFRSKITKHNLNNPTVVTPGLCFKKEVFSNVGYFDITYRICADFDLICRSINAGLTIQYSDVLINNMREGGISSDMKFERIKKKEQFRASNSNTKEFNAKFLYKTIVNYTKSLLLNYLFKEKLRQKKMSVQDEYLEDKIFWFRK